MNSLLKQGMGRSWHPLALVSTPCRVTHPGSPTLRFGIPSGTLNQKWCFFGNVGDSRELTENDSSDSLPVTEFAGLDVYQRNLAAIEERLPDSERLIRARQRVEAILFLSREPLSSRKIAQLACLADATQARTLTRQLNELYRQENHAFQIEESSGGYIMLTRPQFARWLRRLDYVPSDVRLGLPALETLTIIAYKQPVVRAYIESVRGANSDEALRQLLERDLIRIAGRSEELGRPYLYGTTKRFLQMFGLRSLDHLPKKEWVLQTEGQLANPAMDDSIHGT